MLSQQMNMDTIILNMDTIDTMKSYANLFSFNTFTAIFRDDVLFDKVLLMIYQFN